MSAVTFLNLSSKHLPFTKTSQIRFYVPSSRASTLRLGVPGSSKKKKKENKKGSLKVALLRCGHPCVGPQTKINANVVSSSCEWVRWLVGDPRSEQPKGFANLWNLNSWTPKMHCTVSQQRSTWKPTRKRSTDVSEGEVRPIINVARTREADNVVGRKRRRRCHNWARRQMVVGETVGSSLKPYLSIPCNDFRLTFVCSAWESGYQIVARVTPLLFHQTEHLPVNVPKHTPDITRCLQELSSGNGDVSRLSSRQQIVVNLSVCCKIIYDTCMYVWSGGTDSLQVLKREPCGFFFFKCYTIL